MTSSRHIGTRPSAVRKADVETLLQEDAPEAQRRLGHGIVGVLAWLGLFSLASPASAQFSEQEVKAALLLNFARFVTWPDSAFDGGDGAFVIGVVGNSAVAAGVEKVVKGQRAGSRSIVVQRFSGMASVKPCQILYVGKDSAAQLDALGTRAGSSCVTVGDSDDFLRRGGTIRFYLSTDNKVRFEINPRAVTRQRVKPSAALLRLARIASDGS